MRSSRSTNTWSSRRFSAGPDRDPSGNCLPRLTSRASCCPSARWCVTIAPLDLSGLEPVAGAFDYSGCRMPTPAPTASKADGTVTTTVTEDECGRKLTDCTTGSGTDVDLPFGGSPASVSTSPRKADRDHRPGGHRLQAQTLWRGRRRRRPRHFGRLRRLREPGSQPLIDRISDADFAAAGEVLAP